MYKIILRFKEEEEIKNVSFILDENYDIVRDSVKIVNEYGEKTTIKKKTGYDIKVYQELCSLNEEITKNIEITNALGPVDIKIRKIEEEK